MLAAHSETTAASSRMPVRLRMQGWPVSFPTGRARVAARRLPEQRGGRRRHDCSVADGAVRRGGQRTLATHGRFAASRGAAIL